MITLLRDLDQADTFSVYNAAMAVGALCMTWLGLKWLGSFLDQFPWRRIFICVYLFSCASDVLLMPVDLWRADYANAMWHATWAAGCFALVEWWPTARRLDQMALS